MRPRSDPLPRELEEALDAVRARLGVLGTSWLYYPTVGSTNDVAAALAGGSNARLEGAVVMADAQTAGRGRRGRTWFSPPGSGLYISVILLPGRARRSPERATSLLTLAAGVAIAEGIERVTGLGPQIKWPNDLLVGRRKLAGILAEGLAVDRSAGVGHVVLGYGINVGLVSVPADLRERTTSLEAELGRAVDRAAVAAESLAALATRYDDLLAGRFDAILDAWRSRSPSSLGTRVTWAPGSTAGAAGTAAVTGDTRSGLTAGIDEDGALLVRTSLGTERVVAGELTWEI
jgi:BirA family biotin operon repressor/biotin-[acetyl-CoA-carboxylase] ligase